MPTHHEFCEPRPAAMISSLRAIGYDLSMAIADLIDNSIYAQARNIAVDYDWNEGDPWIRITDNGIGMTESKLRDAMRLGSQSPLDVRQEDDLGRFGLGLKTASFSQGRLLTVHTKSRTGQVATRSWDLDHVCSCGKWELSIEAPECSHSLISELDTHEHGTVVLCQKLDRLAQEPDRANGDGGPIFLERFRKVVQYLEMVFHRYLIGRDKVAITVGRHMCQPWDPFLTSNGFTQHLALESLDNHRVKVIPFVLPHVSKRTIEENEKGSGLSGWNAQQGFYIYRNKRMIIPGGYLDLPFKSEEHYKLCRIQVDLSNNLDHDWSIDVRKAAASPPPKVRKDLERIARATRIQAAEVYRVRAGGARMSPGKSVKHEVWLKKRRGEKVCYHINTRNEAITRILSELNAPESWTKKLFYLIEKTVPHRLIIMDNTENEDCQVNLPPEFDPPPKELIDLCCRIFLDRYKKCSDSDAAANFACSFFDGHPAYRSEIDRIVEEIQ